jgi:hypothetical protein
MLMNGKTLGCGKTWSKVANRILGWRVEMDLFKRGEFSDLVKLAQGTHILGV